MIIHNCEQNSDEWFALRAGLPTASSFDKLVTGTGKASAQISGYAATLAAELYAGRPLERWEGNRATERGHEVEPEARAAYAFIHEVEPVQVGLVVNHGAGCSPDSLIGDAGLLEIKSQMAKGHVETLAYHRKSGKVPPSYMPQLQGQLLVCEREWVDIMFYHPDLPGLTIKVYRDESYIRELMRGIQAVIAERDELVAMLRSA